VSRRFARQPARRGSRDVKGKQMMSLQEWLVCWLGAVQRTGLYVALELVTNPNQNGETRFLLTVTCYVPSICRR